MNIATASPKFLYTLAKHFIDSEKITYEKALSSFYDQDDTTDYAFQIKRFLKERNLSSWGSDHFLYTYIKINLDVLFDTDGPVDFSEIEIPKLNTYKYIWDTDQTIRCNIKYEHTFESYLDGEDAEQELEYDRYNGNVYPEDGREVDRDVTDTELHTDSIEKFRKIDY